jgi:hypothetical protein
MSRFHPAFIAILRRTNLFGLQYNFSLLVAFPGADEGITMQPFHKSRYSIDLGFGIWYKIGYGFKFDVDALENRAVPNQQNRRIGDCLPIEL